MTFGLTGGIFTLTRQGAPPTAPAGASDDGAIESFEITQFTTSGNANRPAISADGKYVAFTWGTSRVPWEIPALPVARSCAFANLPILLSIADGISLALVDGRTMLRTAFLIVFVMAGSPVGSLACELWCNSPVGEDHHRAAGCHDAFQSGATGQQIALYIADCDDAAVRITPFVTEARETESRSIGAASVAFFDASSIGPDCHETTTRWCVVYAQPPHSPSSRLVLRI